MEVRIESGSFRDRHGRVFYREDGVYRFLSEQALAEWEVLSSTNFFLKFTKEETLVSTERVSNPGEDGMAQSDTWAAVLKHKIIPFISYPYEWPFGMLKDAALLQLDLLLAALEENMILKDSSPYNVQWQGSSPVFIDIPSFERLSGREPWVGYGQFCQMYLFPLFLQAYKEIPFHPWLRGSIDGVDPQHFSNLMSIRDLLRPGVFTDVYLQAKMQSKYSDTKNNVKDELRRAGFNINLIKSNVKRLRRLVEKLTWKANRSQWSHYSTTHSYVETDYDLKQSFVRDVVKSHPWKLAWDLGSNTGDFARIAAENADYVIAIEADHLAVEILYQRLSAEGNKSILPLVCNLADPSPNLGWQGLERRSLIERGKPDLTLCLALIHHIVIGANIPLKDFVDWIASLGTSLVIEFVTREDPMVKKLLLNKEDIYEDYDAGYFEKCLAGSFEIVRCERFDSNTRIMYFAKAKA